MASDHSIKGHSWKSSDGAETTEVWEQGPEAAAATRPVMDKLRELEGMASFKGNLFKPVFSCNFTGYPRHPPVNLAAFPQRHVDIDMHSIEPGCGFPIHLNDYADENHLVVGGRGKVVIEGGFSTRTSTTSSTSRRADGTARPTPRRTPIRCTGSSSRPPG
jgi:hypothetical protein